MAQIKLPARFDRDSARQLYDWLEGLDSKGKPLSPVQQDFFKEYDRVAPHIENSATLEGYYDDVRALRKSVWKKAQPSVQKTWKKVKPSVAKGWGKTRTSAKKAAKVVKGKTPESLKIPAPRETAVHKFVKYHPYFRKTIERQLSSSSTQAHQCLPVRLWFGDYTKPIIRNIDKAVSDYDFIQPALKIQNTINNITQRLDAHEISEDEAKSEAKEALKPFYGTFGPQTYLQKECENIVQALLEFRKTAAALPTVRDFDGLAGLQQLQKDAILDKIDLKISVFKDLSTGDFYDQYTQALDNSTDLKKDLQWQCEHVLDIASNTHMRNEAYPNLGYSWASALTIPLDEGIPITGLKQLINILGIKKIANKRHLKDHKYEDVIREELEVRVGYANPHKRTEKITTAAELGADTNAERYAIYVEDFYRSRKEDDGTINYNNTHPGRFADLLYVLYQMGYEALALDAVELLIFQTPQSLNQETTAPHKVLQEMYGKDPWKREDEHYKYFVEQVDLKLKNPKHGPEPLAQRHLHSLIVNLLSSWWHGRTFPGQQIFGTPSAEPLWRVPIADYVHELDAFKQAGTPVKEKKDGSIIRTIEPAPKQPWFKWSRYERDENGKVETDDQGQPIKKSRKGLNRVTWVYHDAPVWVRKLANRAYLPFKVYMEKPFKMCRSVARLARKAPDVPGWFGAGKLIHPRVLLWSKKFLFKATAICAIGAVAEQASEKMLNNHGHTNQAIIKHVLYTDGNSDLRIGSTTGAHLDIFSRGLTVCIEMADWYTKPMRFVPRAITLPTDFIMGTNTDRYVDFIDPGSLHPINQTYLGDRGHEDDSSTSKHANNDKAGSDRHEDKGDTPDASSGSQDNSGDKKVEEKEKTKEKAKGSDIQLGPYGELPDGRSLIRPLDLKVPTPDDQKKDADKESEHSNPVLRKLNKKFKTPIDAIKSTFNADAEGKDDGPGPLENPDQYLQDSPKLSALVNAGVSSAKFIGKTPWWLLTIVGLAGLKKTFESNVKRQAKGKPAKGMFKRAMWATLTVGLITTSIAMGEDHRGDPGFDGLGDVPDELFYGDRDVLDASTGRPVELAVSSHGTGAHFSAKAAGVADENDFNVTSSDANLTLRHRHLTEQRRQKRQSGLDEYNLDGLG